MFSAWAVRCCFPAESSTVGFGTWWCHGNTNNMKKNTALIRSMLVLVLSCQFLKCTSVFPHPSPSWFVYTVCIYTGGILLAQPKLHYCLHLKLLFPSISWHQLAVSKRNQLIKTYSSIRPHSTPQTRCWARFPLQVLRGAYAMLPTAACVASCWGFSELRGLGFPCSKIVMMTENRPFCLVVSLTFQVRSFLCSLLSKVTPAFS